MSARAVLIQNDAEFAEQTLGSEIHVLPDDLRLVLDIVDALQERLAQVEVQARAAAAHVSALMSHLEVVEAALAEARRESGREPVGAPTTALATR